MGCIGNGRLAIGVTRFEKSVALEAGQTAGFAGTLVVYRFFAGGDHVPLKEAEAPTVTLDTINPEIIHSVARYVTAQAWRLANLP